MDGAVILPLLALHLVLTAPQPQKTVVSWQPARPAQGVLLRIFARPPRDGAPQITGVFAGEKLHFERDASGLYRALAGVPVDAESPVSLHVSVELTDERTESLTALVPVRPGRFPVQRLSVASRYGREPDPATAARIAAEAAKARAVSERAHETPKGWTGDFIRPAGGRVSAPFGVKRVFNGQLKSRHTGVDFAAGAGAPVKAANDGEVALIGNFYLGGRCVYLDHGAGFVTAYLHLSRVEVKPGDRVRKGQVIGRVGATGRVTGPHLHWIVRYGKVSIDPLTLPGIR